MDTRRSGSGDRSSPPLREVTELGEFEGILRSHNHILVDFYAEWCGSCRLMEDTVDTVARESDAVVVKVNVEEVPQLALEYDVHGLPAILIFQDGEVRERLVGMQEKDALLNALA